ncbi:MAG: septum formation initiator family protein [Nitrospirota bacterium]
MRKRAKPKNLRQQVSVERRKRNILFFMLTGAGILYLGGALLFGDMGFIKYAELKRTKRALEKEITTLEEENRSLQRHVTALKEDRFYIEKHAREEYGLARPDEYIFQFKQDGR